LIFAKPENSSEAAGVMLPQTAVAIVVILAGEPKPGMRHRTAWRLVNQNPENACF